MPITKKATSTKKSTNKTTVTNQKKEKFTMFKDKPLVRSGNVLYYGDMSDDYVARLTVKNNEKNKDLNVADKVSIQLINTDPTADIKKAIIKSSEKNGLYPAIDIADVWLHRALSE